MTIISNHKVREQLNAMGDFNGTAAKCLRTPDFLNPGPLIIGGVGDSGTSAIVSVYMHLCIYMCLCAVLSLNGK
jgi:hypothetical protein